MELSILEHQGWDHRRSDPGHDQVGAQGLVLPICSLGLQQVLLELLVEEVVPTAFLLRLQDEVIGIGDGFFNDFIHFCTLLAEVFQAPNPFKQAFERLCSWVGATDFSQQSLVGETLLELFESGQMEVN